MRNKFFKKSKMIKKQLRAMSRSLISEYPGYSLISEPTTAREKHYLLVGYMLTVDIFTFYCPIRTCIKMCYLLVSQIRRVRSIDPISSIPE